ncbi:MAG: glycine--tRNA ligase subunit beta [Paracoccaceae bacterium]|nr:glycine--tRNA ligase subunit beta [Paracoccaceae bacterium]
MPDLLLELFSEEMPADAQVPASDNLKKYITDGFINESVSYANAASFSTPQRLCVVIEGLAAISEKKVESKRGPKVDAPRRAVEGFASSVNLKIGDLKIKEEEKGKYYFAELHQPVSRVEDLASKIVKDAILNLGWRKSMRWGNSQIKWVRPLRSILCVMTFEDRSEIVSMNIGDIKASNETCGHRFMCPDKFTVDSFECYQDKLRKSYVILDPIERAEIIWTDASNLAFSHGLRVIKDDNLLNEVSALVEWPSVLMGEISNKYLDLPSELLQTSMKVHQKFFSLVNDKNKKIEKFITVANVICDDNGQTIIKGNQKVLDARLADGKFFFENDLKIAKEGGSSWMANLNDVVFHGKLGSLSDRVVRINRLALKLAPYFEIENEKICKAVNFSKTDLCSQMVYEFPELQGVMGKYYAEAAGYDNEIALAILEHYQPQGPSDKLPSQPLSVILALADKIDLLSCFWSIDEKPTGSKDPYALRRAAIGVIRLILNSGVNINLQEILSDKVVNFDVPKDEIIHFLHERLKVLFRDRGDRYDVIEACLNASESNDLVLLEEKINALGSFLSTDNGIKLLKGFKRANNILVAEEKKDGVIYELDPELKYMKNSYEKNLFKAINKIQPEIKKELKKKNFEAVLLKTTKLLGPIDDFFIEVKVNDESQITRRNRLCLLNSVKNICSTFCDLTLIQDITSQIDN